MAVKARRRLLSLGKHILLSPRACATRPTAPEEEIWGPQVGLFSSSFTSSANALSEERLKELFGPEAWIEGPLAKHTNLGRRLHNVNLSRGALSPVQAAFLVDALSEYGIITFPNQDLEKFTLSHYERFANHFGAPQPMFADQEPGQPIDRDKQPLKVAEKIRARVNQTFPDELRHMPTNSQAILTITNVEPPRKGARPTVRGGGGWHTDQDHERIPCSASMFLVHRNPTFRDPKHGTWLDPSAWDHTKNHEKLYVNPPGDPREDPELTRLRANLPLNAETGYADTVAAFAALPKEEQERLEKIYLVKYEKQGDDERGLGYLCPLVRTNPRNGLKSLYSPNYGIRFKGTGVPLPEIEGMTPDETMKFLNRLEAHCLQPQFRYDHFHRAGDLTVWNNYSLMHCAPPVKIGINAVEDARLYYRISTKGSPAIILPRKDDPTAKYTQDPAWLRRNFVTPYSTPLEIINVD